jgi:hypothetical protein
MQQDVHRQYHQTLLLMHNPTPAAPTTGNGYAANVFDSDGAQITGYSIQYVLHQVWYIWYRISNRQWNVYLLYAN